ncbi:MAG: zinc-dependent alcohol dehydrogenase family protein [Proteobacteria bacterium]|nr:zinc-dependent alcohol dehydrogenase family protein [Pseudomonadota bacterium]MDA1059980.1 zinc-dependent alcohol dehydrogenase family protein [Pseudomonadota bacterium]
MRVARYARYGAPDAVLELLDEDSPIVAAGDVAIRVEAAPVHIADLKCITGEPNFRMFPLPAVPGFEGIGRVTRIGAGVADFSQGDRVFLPLACGAWREEVVATASDLMPAPEGDAVQLSLLPINPPTSYLMLNDYGDLEKGDWVIQNAANSSCGVYLIKLAQLRGIKTVNVVRRASLAPALKNEGADVVLVDGPDLAARVREATGGAAIKLAIDAVAGDATTRLGECLVDGGTILSYGMLSGEPCKLPPDMVFLRDIRLRGFYTVRQFTQHEPHEIAAMYRDLANLVADGTLRARIAGTFPLDQAVDACALAAKVGEDRPGKVIITMT